MNRSPSSPGSNNPPGRQKFLEVVLYPPVLIVRSQKGHCQVDEELVDQPPRYWAPARRDPAMLGIKNGRQPQLDNTGEGLHLVLDSTGLSRESCHQQGVAPIRVCNLLKSCASAVENLSVPKKPVLTPTASRRIRAVWTASSLVASLERTLDPRQDLALQ